MPETEGVLIVDGANWAYALEENTRVDFEALVYRLQEATGIKIVGMTFYTAYRTEEDLSRRWLFMNYLKNLGWIVNAMPATQGVDGRWRDKGVDIAIAIDAYEEVCSGRVKAILIGSGDADFAALFRRLPEDVAGWVVSFKSAFAHELSEVANSLFIEDLGVLFRES